MATRLHGAVTPDWTLLDAGYVIETDEVRYTSLGHNSGGTVNGIWLDTGETFWAIIADENAELRARGSWSYVRVQ